MLIKWMNILSKDIESSLWKAKMYSSDWKLLSTLKTIWKECLNFWLSVSINKPKSLYLPGQKKSSKVDCKICKTGIPDLASQIAASITMNLILGSNQMIYIWRKRQNWNIWNQDKLWKCGKRNRLKMLKATKKFSNKSMLHWKIYTVWDILRTLWKIMQTFISEISQSKTRSKAISRIWEKMNMFIKAFKGIWNATLS